MINMIKNLYNKFKQHQKELDLNEIKGLKESLSYGLMKMAAENDSLACQKILDSYIKIYNKSGYSIIFENLSVTLYKSFEYSLKLNTRYVYNELKIFYETMEKLAELKDDIIMKNILEECNYNFNKNLKQHV